MRIPSPVVARWRKTMWPDCSPPRASPSASSAASTWRSPTGVSRTAMPRSAMARRNPRLVMTVTTTVSPASSPRAGQVDGEEGQQGVAVGHRPGVVDGHQAVGVAVEGQPEVGPGGHHRGGQRLGVGRAAAVVDVRSRRARQAIAVTVGPQRGEDHGGDGAGRAVGAVEHDRQAVEPPTAEGAAPGGPRSRPAPVGVGREAAHARRRSARARRPSARRALDGRLRLGSVSLVPPGPEQLDAVVLEGVVGGRDHGRRQAPALGAARPRRGWGGRPGRPRRPPRRPGRPRGPPGGGCPNGGCPVRPGRRGRAAPGRRPGRGRAPARP